MPLLPGQIIDVVESLTRAASRSGKGGLSRGLFLGGLGLDFGIRGATYQRHHLASSLAGGIGGNIGALLGEAVGNALVPIPGLNFLAGATLGYIGYSLGDKVAKPVQNLVELDRRMRHIDMGGSYQDTQQAWTMRQKAAQQLGSSLLNARQILGQEAAFFHQ